MLVSKYADHQPSYRQSGIFARKGVELDRSTLADRVGKSTALLEPLAGPPSGRVQGLDACGWFCRFNALYQNGAIQEVACLAHIRRKLFDIHAA